MTDKELLERAKTTIDKLEAAVANLLPGARHIVADIGLINDALVQGAKTRCQILLRLKEG